MDVFVLFPLDPEAGPELRAGFAGLGLAGRDPEQCRISVEPLELRWSEDSEDAVNLEEEEEEEDEE